MLIYINLTRFWRYTLHLILAIAVLIFPLPLITPDNWAESKPEVNLEQPLSLEALIKIALDHNAAIVASEKGVEIAAKGKSIAHRQRLPRLDLTSSGQQADFDNMRILMESIYNVPLGFDARNGKLVSKESLQFFDATLHLTQPLFTWGRLNNEVKANEIAIQIAKDKLTQTRDEIIFNLSSAYYNLLKLQKVLAANERAIENLEESQRVVKEFVQTGRAPELDLFRVNTRLASVRQNSIRIQNAIELTRGIINALLGLEDITQRLEIVDELNYTPQKVELKKSIDSALERNPVYQSLQKETQRQRLQISIARSELLPNFFLNGQFTEMGTSTRFREFFPLEDDLKVMVSLSVPIFDWGAIRAKVSREKLELEQLQAQLEKLKRDVSIEVQRAYLNRLEAEERLKTAEAALEEARESLRIEQTKLELGKGIINDTLDAQADLLQAEVAYSEALSDYNVSFVALEKAIGSIKFP